MSLIAAAVIVGHKHNQDYPDYLPQDEKSMVEVIEYIKQQTQKEQKRISIKRSHRNKSKIKYW